MILGDHVQPRILISWRYWEIMFSQESWTADDIGRSCSAKNPDQLTISGDHVQPRILISWWYQDIMFSQESWSADAIGRSHTTKNPDQLMILGDYVQPRILISWWYRKIMFSQESLISAFCVRISERVFCIYKQKNLWNFVHVIIFPFVFGEWLSYIYNVS